MFEDIEVKIARELVELSGMSKNELEAQNNLLLIFELLQQGKVTLSRASELAGMKVDQFMNEFRKRRLVRLGGPESAKEAEQELQNALKYLK